MKALSNGPSYGYEILGTLSDNGFGEIKGGTLYPLLSRLEVAGYVATQWREGSGGPGRKYFQLTDDGVCELAMQLVQWRAFVDTTSNFFAKEK
ncbi:MAG: PadR family transcriptional regulator [Propionibacteriaceae bacterium]